MHKVCFIDILTLLGAIQIILGLMSPNANDEWGNQSVAFQLEFMLEKHLLLF